MTTRPKTQPEQPDAPASRPDWPRQLVLPGQTAAPDGPVDMRNMYVMHHAFRRDLDAFVEACRRTPVLSLSKGSSGFRRVQPPGRHSSARRA
jgi:hypothetical protein